VLAMSDEDRLRAETLAEKAQSLAERIREWTTTFPTFALTFPTFAFRPTGPGWMFRHKMSIADTTRFAMRRSAYSLQRNPRSTKRDSPSKCNPATSI